VTYILEPHHHRTFGGVASIKHHFERAEFLRLHHLSNHIQKPKKEKDAAMAAALGPLPAAADFQGSRAADSKALLEADALRWLAYRMQRLSCDDERAFQDLIFFWVTEFHKSVDSTDIPQAWRYARAGELLEEIRMISEEMLRRDPETKGFPAATWTRVYKLLDRTYELELAMDEELLKAAGGSKRPVINK